MNKVVNKKKFLLKFYIRKFKVTGVLVFLFETRNYRRIKKSELYEKRRGLKFGLMMVIGRGKHFSYKKQNLLLVLNKRLSSCKFIFNFSSVNLNFLSNIYNSNYIL